MLVTGASTQVTLRDLQVENGCLPDAVRTSSGARLTDANLEVARSAALPCPALLDLVFRDGFESGNLSAWSGPT